MRKNTFKTEFIQGCTPMLGINEVLRCVRHIVGKFEWVIDRGELSININVSTFIIFKNGTKYNK